MQEETYNPSTDNYGNGDAPILNSATGISNIGTFFSVGFLILGVGMVVLFTVLIVFAVKGEGLGGFDFNFATVGVIGLSILILLLIVASIAVYMICSI